MKEIIAIIRNECVEPTKDALDAIGVKGTTFSNVIGRGRQKGVISSPDPEGTLRREVGVHLMHTKGMIEDPGNPKYHVPMKKETELGFIPKKMLVMVAQDTEMPLIVSTILKINRSNNHGDGRIFVCPVADAVRVRTGEKGVNALQ